MASSSISSCRRNPWEQPGRHENQRGATFVEALCTMSVLALLWAGAMHFGKITLLRLEAEAKARDCAWRIALDACQAPPDGCTVAGTSPDPEQPDLEKIEYESDPTEANGEFDDDWEGDTGSDSSENARNKVKGDTEAQIDGLILTRVRMTDSKEAERPALLGGETITLGGSMSLPCNPPSMPSPDELAQSVFSDLTGD